MTEPEYVQVRIRRWNHVDIPARDAPWLISTRDRMSEVMDQAAVGDTFVFRIIELDREGQQSIEKY